nr:hypothetical protein [Xenococcaceae cyanobacterium MO_188.B19]
FFWALAKKVASFPLLQYQHWKSQSRTKIMTTAAPVGGISLGSSTSIEQQTSETRTEEQPDNVNSPANQSQQR